MIPILYKRIFYIIFLLSLIFSFLVIGISYHVLHQLTFTKDPIIYGKKQSELINEIKNELLKRGDISTVSFFSEDGIKLSGYLIKRKNAQSNLILCHGYLTAKEFLYGYVDLFQQSNILFFDFRAHGQSEGRAISIGCHEYKDVIAAVNFMKNNIKKIDGNNFQLILLGISMGGASALKAASILTNLCDALVIDSTYSNLEKTLLRSFKKKTNLAYYPFFPILKKMFQYFTASNVSSMDISKCVEGITTPIFFIHSCSDNVLKPSNSIELYQHSIAQYSKLWIAPKCRHGWLHSYYSTSYKSKVLRFLKKAKINIA